MTTQRTVSARSAPAPAHDPRDATRDARVVPAAVRRLPVEGGPGGLLSSHRHGRPIVFRVDPEGPGRLLAFPSEDCHPRPPRASCRPGPPRCSRTRRRIGVRRLAESARHARSNPLRSDLQRPLPLRRQFGSQHHGRGDPGPRRSAPVPGLQRRQPPGRQSQSLYPRPAEAVQPSDGRAPLQELGRLRGARCAQDGFRLHRMRHRGGRSLPGLAPVSR